jgi:hypothetical protein
MFFDHQVATKIYENLPKQYRIPHCHPTYLAIDALRGKNRIPEFFIFQKNNNFYYHGYIKGSADQLVDHESPYGYGGPIATSSDQDFINEAWEAYAQSCHATNTIAEFIRFHPMLNNCRFYKGAVTDNRKTVWIDLQSDYAHQYKERTVQKIRYSKARGVAVRWDKSHFLYEFFCETYYQHMAQLNADPIYFFSQEYLSQLLFWDKAHLAIAFQGDAPIAAAMFLIDGYICDYHLAATKNVKYAREALTVLVDAAAEYAQKQGCRILHLGGGRTQAPDDTLLFFKESFSDQRSYFRVGSTIWNFKIIDGLRKDFIHRNGREPNKILFYR